MKLIYMYIAPRIRLMPGSRVLGSKRVALKALVRDTAALGETDVLGPLGKSVDDSDEHNDSFTFLVTAMRAA